ncbi:hypothetical protein B0T17DRAFT_194819 [Bombardia bombarda]|uniref:Uncharacterized protein n=1 Tax=Bombardia bombarda TaxID=252184 RepID=A0AA39XAJ1_9PEZI|nr:hypothetical protein B0T17DRAFT_194819 [Bombardia bombarda]
MATMWDRLKTGPPKQHLGGRFDDDGMLGGGLRSMTNNQLGTRGYSYSIKGGPPPSRPPREFFEAQQHDTAPAVQEPPSRNPNRISVRASNFRSQSSAYSQSNSTSQYSSAARSRNNYSHYPANLASRQSHRYGGGSDGISPPSSPEPDSAGYGYDLNDDVSPIEEEMPDIPQYDLASSSRNNRRVSQTVHVQPETRQPPPQQIQPKTNIPMMRRERRKQQSDAVARDTQSRERLPAHQYQQPRGSANQEPRWDALTGERTSSPRGWPSQVKPAEFAHGLGISTRAASPPQKSPPVTSSFGDRVRRIAKKAGQVGRENETDPAAGAFTVSRPGWHGASGRTAIVDPVHDNPEVPPLRIPDKSGRRVISPVPAPAGPRLGPSGGGGVARRGQTPPISPRGAETAAGSDSRDMAGRVVPSSQQQPYPVTNSHPQDGQGYPSPPLSGALLPGGDAPAVAAQELARTAFTNTMNIPPPLSSPVSPTMNQNNHNPYDNATMIRRKPPPPAHANQHHYRHNDSISSVYSQPDGPPIVAATPPPHPHQPEAATRNTIAPDDPWVQPPSRFSITTYATSTAETPRESLDDFDHHDRPPVPELPRRLLTESSPQGQAPPPHQAESVMDRSRPKLNIVTDDRAHSSARNSPIIVSLKDQFVASPFSTVGDSQAARDRKAAATAQNPNIIRAQTATTTERPTSAASGMNKVLPLAPPETTAGEARDRVGVLNAQLLSLANRRLNINRSIKQMTELMPMDKLMNSDEVVRKREMEKHNIERLRQELSEVQREEYELGLKLHRAYKRLDKDAEWEPTTLWVRRVTS